MTTDRIPDEALAQVSGGAAMTNEFRTYLNLVSNPNVRLTILKEMNGGDADSAYRHLYQMLMGDNKTEQAHGVKQLYADTHDGAKIPGIS